MEKHWFVAYSGNFYCNKLDNMSIGHQTLKLAFDLEMTLDLLDNLYLKSDLWPL